MGNHEAKVNKSLRRHVIEEITRLTGVNTGIDLRMFKSLQFIPSEIHL